MKIKKKPLDPVTTALLTREMKQHGYSYDLRRDGVTQSMLTLWLTCREQCRLQYLKGWRVKGVDNFSLSYGSAMHWCLAEVYSHSIVKPVIPDYDELWKRENPNPMKTDIDLHQRTMAFLRAILPLYLERAGRNTVGDLYDDFSGKKKWMHTEKNFKVDFNSVPVNGRFDGVFEMGKDTLWIAEHKNMGRIDEDAIAETMPFIMQDMLYPWAASKVWPGKKIGGVVKNILRIPQLKQKENESDTLFIARIVADIRERPDWYFMRCQMSLHKGDLEHWEATQLRPLMEDFVRWYEGVKDWDGKTIPWPSGHYINGRRLVDNHRKCDMYYPITQRDFSNCEHKKQPFTELV